MAIIKTSFFSQSLRRTVPFMAVIPNDPFGMDAENGFATGPFRTVYLLHGMFGNEQDYLANSRIQELSEKYSLAVIMPAGDNSFYIDDEEKVNCYGKYIGDELIRYTRALFPLSCKREDTFIGGLSMGGYGAMRNGLKYADTFSKICAFSGAYVVLRIIDNDGEPFTDTFSGPDFQRRTFGNLKKLEGSDVDPRICYRTLKEQGKDIPKIFMTEGTEDFLRDVNHIMRDFLMEMDADFSYTEDEGVHDWNFWNKHMEEAFQWLVE